MSTSGYDPLIRGGAMIGPAQKIPGRRDSASRVERAITLADAAPAGLVEVLVRFHVSWPGY